MFHVFMIGAVDMRKYNDDCAGIGEEQHLPHRVEQYDDAARAVITAEFERRKREEGIALRPGGDLRREGHAFFQADRDYFLKPLPDKGLIEVSAFNRYDEALLDFDGRIDYECYYDWWYLDEGLEPIQGFMRPISDSLSNRSIFKHKYEALQEGAVQALRGIPPKSDKVPKPALKPGTEPVQGTPPQKRTLLDWLKGLFLNKTGTRRPVPKPASSVVGGERRSELSHSAMEPSRNEPSASGLSKPARLSVERKQQCYQTAYELVSPWGKTTIVDFDKTIQHYPGTENEDAWLEYWTSEKPLENCVLYGVDFTPVGQDAMRMVWMIQPDGRYWADESGFGMENDQEICLYSMLDARGRFAHPFRLYSIGGKRVAQEE